MKILLAIDGSEHTRRMLSYIAAHDELLGPGHDYALITVVAPVPAHAASYLDRKTLDEYYRDEGEKVFKPVRPFVEQQGWKARFVQATGRAAEVVAALAESDKYSLVVMGAHGHSALGTVILGSVTTGVLARCKTPVLLIR